MQCRCADGAPFDVPALIGNIAHKTRSHLQWDAQAERFTNNDKANEYCTMTTGRLIS